MAGINEHLILVLVGIILLAVMLLLLRRIKAQRGQKIILAIDTSTLSGLAARPSKSFRVDEPTPAEIAQMATAGDDLTRIKGVGPKIAGLLHRQGVHHFAQIAAWNDSDITAVDATLGSFAGRPRRDQWVEQAKLLAAGDSTGFETKFGALGPR
jgi:predicted flap endonuclease-1-like 5' DNA nuclease